MNNPNPYQAPETQESFTFEEKPRVSTVRRPLSVWVTLVLLIVLLAIFIWGLVTGFYHAFSNSGNIKSFPYLLIALLIRLAILTIPAMAVWGIFKRTQIGRWAGVVSLLLIFAAGVYGNMHPSQNPNRFEYKNDAERFGGTVGGGLVTCGFLALIYRYGFGRKAKAYFGPPTDEDEGYQ